MGRMNKIKGFSRYWISDDGEIYSTWGREKRYRGVNMKRIVPHLSHNGYEQVRLVNDNGEVKGKRVQRLVAEAFFTNYSSKLQVNHKDGDKTNNNINNLEMCTCSENIKHAYKNKLRSQDGEKNHQSKLNEHKVKRIRLMKEITPKLSNEKIGKLFGVSGKNINLIINGKRWKHCY